MEMYLIFFIYNFVDTNIFRIFVVSERNRQDSSKKDQRHSTQAARLPKAVYKTRQGGTRIVDMSGRYATQLVCVLISGKGCKPCKWCEFHEPEQLGIILRNK